MLLQCVTFLYAKYGHMHYYCCHEYKQYRCILGVAKDIVQKLEDQLNYLDTYTNPKLLQCFHVHCKECQIPGCQGSSLHFTSTISWRLWKNTRRKRTTEGVATGVALQQQSSHCTEHVDEELKLYCETCSEVICFKCVSTKWGRHHGHDYEPINEAFQKYKEETSAFLVPMGNQFTRINQALTNLETCSAEVDVRQDLVKANIEGTVRELHGMLEARKTELLHHLQEMSLSKHKSLAAQKDLLETTRAQLHSCEGFVRQSIKTECQSEVLKMRKTIVHQAKELTTEFPPSFLKPCTEPDMMFSAPGDATTVLQQYGDVSSMSMVEPAKCHAMGEGRNSYCGGEVYSNCAGC